MNFAAKLSRLNHQHMTKENTRCTESSWSITVPRGYARTMNIEFEDGYLILKDDGVERSGSVDRAKWVFKHHHSLLVGWLLNVPATG